MVFHVLQQLLASLVICVLHVRGTSVSLARYGTIKGIFDSTEGVTRFLGVPYAQAPVGERRFSAPAELKPWADELQCASYKPACPQVVGLFSPTSNFPSSFSEDCLYLNIFVPNEVDSKKSLPVLVHFHGGMFQVGSAEGVDGTKLAVRDNVIVITFNYRLGVMGFLGRDNYGLWDQNMALRWVQDNVGHFGGSPEQVTLAGSGSGAFAVGLHTLADVSNSLFRRAIMLGGSPYQNDYIIPSISAKDATKLFYEKVSCKFGNLQCLRKLSVEKIVETQKEISGSEVLFTVREDGQFVPRPSLDHLSRNDSKRTVTECILGLNVNSGGIDLVTDSIPSIEASQTIEGFTAQTYPDVSEALAHLIAIEYGDTIDSLQTIRRDAVAGSIRAGQMRISETGIAVFAYINTSPDASYPGSLMSPSTFGTLNNDLSRLVREFVHSGKPSLRSGFEWPVFDKDNKRMLVLDKPSLGTDSIVTQYPEEIEKRMSLWADAVPSMIQGCESCHDSAVTENEGPVLTLPQGQVRGQRIDVGGEKGCNLYQGIPYAKPPVGELRFRPPQPHSGWTGILEPQKIPVSCPVVDKILQYISEVFSEDCLFLDVYVPEGTRGKKLPVMIFVHGGGFSLGSKNMYNGAALTTYDVIVVTINYRLSVLGFMSTEDDVSPGNYGLMDQKLAMTWVKQNIQSFGGDPDRITIFGQSAGAGAVALQMLVPSNKGLFQNVLAQSGSSFLMSGIGIGYRSSTEKLAKSYNCSTFNSHVMVDCLRRIDPHKLCSLEHLPILEQAELSFFPRIDGYLFPKPIDELFKDGVTRDFNFMTGTTRDEGYMFLVGMNDLFLRPEYMDPTKLVSRAFNYFYNDLMKVRARGQGINDTEFVRMGTDFNTDSVFLAFCDQDANLNARYGGTTYRYMMSFHSAHPGWPGFFENAEWTLGNHGDDLHYTFGAPLHKICKVGWLPDNFTWPERDIEFSKRMMMTWTNFAHTGNPNEGPSSVDYEWPVYTEEQPLVFEFRDKLSEAKGREAVINRNEHPDIFRPQSMRFWNEVMPRLRKLDNERAACRKKDDESEKLADATSASAPPDGSENAETSATDVDGGLKSHEEL